MPSTHNGLGYKNLIKMEFLLATFARDVEKNIIAIRALEMTKERLFSFAEYAKDVQPEVLVTLIQTIVERIYIVDKDDERYCHIFINGCSGEDYTSFIQTAGYIEQKTTPVCDSEQDCICAEVYFHRRFAKRGFLSKACYIRATPISYFGMIYIFNR